MGDPFAASAPDNLSTSTVTFSRNATEATNSIVTHAAHLIQAQAYRIGTLGLSTQYAEYTPDLLQRAALPVNTFNQVWVPSHRTT